MSTYGDKNTGFFCGADKVWRLEFTDIAEMVEYAFSWGAGVSDHAKQYALSSYEAYKKTEFTNWHSEESIRAALVNCPKSILNAVDDMRSKFADLAPPVQKRRKMIRNREEGEEVQVDRYLEGEENCWIQSKRTPQQKRIVTIGVNVACLCTREQSDLLWRGAAGAAISDVLQCAGYSTSIYLFKAGKELSSKLDVHLTRVQLKSPDESLDVGAVALALSDIGFLRTVVFAATARAAHGKIARNFGYTTSIPPTDAKDFDVVIEQDVFTHQSAIEAVRKALGGEGV